MLALAAIPQVMGCQLGAGSSDTVFCKELPWQRRVAYCTFVVR